jgi:hypothetical protein
MWLQWLVAIGFLLVAPQMFSQTPTPAESAAPDSPVDGHTEKEPETETEPQSESAADEDSPPNPEDDAAPGDGDEEPITADDDPSSAADQQSDEHDEMVDDTTGGQQADEFAADDAMMGPGSDMSGLDGAPLTVQVQLGRKWLDGGDFNADTFEFITEWYILDAVPLKLGPVLTYSNLNDLTTGYINGQLIEFGIRSSFFWDFGMWAPYAAIEYSLISSGSLDLKHQAGNQLSRGSIDIKTSGFDVKLGTQIALSSQLYLTVEGSVANSETVQQSGTIRVITFDETNDEFARSTAEIDNEDTTKFASLAFGVLFEL